MIGQRLLKRLALPADVAIIKTNTGCKRWFYQSSSAIKSWQKGSRSLFQQRNFSMK
jgi:hypothetical protein